MNVRVGALIVCGNSVLLTSDSRFCDSYPMLNAVGGRVKFTEDSYTALKRELREELGEAANCLGYGSFVDLDENFFEWQ